MDDKKIKKDKKMETAKEEIASLMEKCAEYENNWKRAVADYQNLKKRTEEERITFLKYANKEILSDFLTVLDNFEAVNKHLDDAGLTISINYLKDLLKRYGVEEVVVLNTDFDPSKAEAIEMVEGDKNKVVEVITKGYTLNGNLLRVARVKVGNGN